MATTDSYYTKEEKLAELQKGRDLVRVMIGHKNLRGEAKTYLDIRAWYPDDEGIYRPGKGFAKPLSKSEMETIANSILDYCKEEVNTEG